jgi:hypothetical protein
VASGLLGESTNGSVIDVEAFFDSDVGRSLARIVNLGCLVSIGSTRDGGAIAINITHDGDWDKEYFRAAADATDWLDRAYAVLTQRGLTPRNGDRPPAEKARRSRSRLT